MILHPEECAMLTRSCDTDETTMLMTRLSPNELSTHLNKLMCTMVDRRNPDQPCERLMESTEALGIIQAGSSINLLSMTSLSKDDLPVSHDSSIIEPQEVTIHAQWNSPSIEQVSTSSNANVFGNLGVLATPKDISRLPIPTMNALEVPPSFLHKYGAKLIPVDKPIQVEAATVQTLETLYFVSYHFESNYIDEYVLSSTGGGGVFVETHPFAHLFMPLSPMCSGALILGHKNSEGCFSFAAFQIPFGYAMHVDAMVIHGDSFFVGNYAISLTTTELADSVVFRSDTHEREILPIEQIKVTPVKMSFFNAEARLAYKVNEKIHMNKLLHELEETCWVVSRSSG